MKLSEKVFVILLAFMLIFHLGLINIDASKEYLAPPYRNEYTERSFEDKIKLQGKAAKVPVLMYHHLLMSKDKKIENSLILTVEEFKKQMEYLHENNYNTITIRELELFLNNKLELPQKSVLVTFDDGYKSNYMYAYPMLKQYGFKASISIIPKLMPEKTEKFNPSRLNRLSWEEVYWGNDVFEYVNHSYSHVSMKKISIRGAYEEISKAEQFIKTKYFVYPIGHTSPASEAVLKKLGYRLAFTTKPGFVTRSSNRLYLPRQRISSGISIKGFAKLLQQ